MQPGCCDPRTWNSIQLRIYPIADCTHGSICAPKCQLVAAIDDALKNSAGIFPDATGQNKTGATSMVAPADLGAAELSKRGRCRAAFPVLRPARDRHSVWWGKRVGFG